MDLSSWSLSEGLGRHLSGQHLRHRADTQVVTTSPVTYAGLGYPVLDWGAGGLNNSGELIALRAPDGSVVESVEFSDAGDWDSAPDGMGPSLERLHLDMDAHLPAAGRHPLGPAELRETPTACGWIEASVSRI